MPMCKGWKLMKMEFKFLIFFKSFDDKLILTYTVRAYEYVIKMLTGKICACIVHNSGRSGHFKGHSILLQGTVHDDLKKCST